eukprot:CAMPEP_0182426186 /NCGR_PEP_ID=MMETSP1167-20130531/12674_1 /TAXON_ID=2988 /ORGANISM="Mallomonas Sp, Strain CCMP3275" /LENGTH=421 /DNA_ID=CAMNT_0024607451 /DNA_START=204 /DNA_END=1469 /DNA_ORIENTATION=+
MHNRNGALARREARLHRARDNASQENDDGTHSVSPSPIASSSNLVAEHFSPSPHHSNVHTHTHCHGSSHAVSHPIKRAGSHGDALPTLSHPHRKHSSPHNHHFTLTSSSKGDGHGSGSHPDSPSPHFHAARKLSTKLVPVGQHETGVLSRGQSERFMHSPNQRLSQKLSVVSTGSRNKTPGGSFNTADTVTARYMLRPEMQALEKELVKRAQIAMQRNPGPSFGGSQLMQSISNVDVSATLITDHIVLGAREDAADLVKLQTLGITHVLNVAVELPNFHESSHKFIYEKLNFKDAPDVMVSQFWGPAASFLRHVEEVKGRVLIHCIAGVSRSVTLLIMHMISCHRRTLRAAHAFIHARRPFIGPNEGFKLQLARFEVSELGYSSLVGVDAGPHWDFYELNKLKDDLPKGPPPRGEGLCVIL